MLVTIGTKRLKGGSKRSVRQLKYKTYKTVTLLNDKGLFYFIGYNQKTKALKILGCNQVR